MRVAVDLTWGEVYRAGEAALQRKVTSLKRGGDHLYGAEQQNGFGLGLDAEFIGCLGEMAVAKHLNLYWGATELGSVDVGNRYEVRATTYSDGRLIGHDKDDDDLPFVLACVIKRRLPAVVLAGWMLGRDMKRAEWFGEANPARPNGRHAYWVPDDALHSMATFNLEGF